MIYQAYDKTYLAEFLGLPSNTFYLWEYKKWAALRTKFEAFKDEAWDWWNASGQFTNSEKVLTGDIWKMYKEDYEKKRGKTLRKEYGL